ncbi:YicC/YloC family endoribonuclease [Kallipyga gabonensis]|uniref:YicC/YloC family endoribonuclease n=1 Tax=Kallipyga gabonensis TaxID=1686287 RepID=UPI0006B5CCD2|nr:YicC/YloC family endoribonuclease [Kallipyga gabonensis]
MHSMTGYGKAALSQGSLRLEGEISTVNNRFLDLYIHLPDPLRFLEPVLRKEVEGRIHRGRVNVTLTDLSQSLEAEYQVNKDALFQIAKDLEDFTEEFISSQGGPMLRLDELVKLPGVMVPTLPTIDEETWQTLAMSVVDRALDQVEDLREGEGERLKENLLEKLNSLSDLVSQIDERAPKLVLEEKDRLNKRVEELLSANAPLDEGRLENELAIFVQKAAIDEEIVRLKSHIKSFNETLHKHGPVGKTLDFIIQEMNREVNTIGSKSNDESIRSWTIQGKTKIEEIREQIQNVE